MYSFVIKIAIDVDKAVEDVNFIPMLGFIDDIGKVVVADLEPNNILVIIKDNFFWTFILLQKSSQNNHYQF